MNILIAGFPYIRSTYRDTFKSYPEKDAIFFLLPRHWSIKNGAVIFDAPKEPNIFSARAFFNHSNYPLIGGLLKGWMPAFPVVLSSIGKSKKIDIVYSCSEPILLTTLYQAIFSKIMGYRHVFFSWENIPYKKKFRGLNLFIKESILRLNISLSQGIIVGNSKGKEILKNYTSKRIEVIPMSGVDVEFFKKESIPKEFNGVNLEDKVVFTFAGAIGFRKGLTYLIEAFSKLRREVTNSFLIIAGSGEYEKELSKEIENLSDSVLRVPWLDREHLKNLLNVSDVFVYPSISHGGWQEQFGYSMAEASLMELPVLATNSGSISEVVINGETGVLAEEGNSDSIYRTMLELCQDKMLRTKLGQAGRNYIAEHYSNDVVARKFHYFFNTILQ